MPRTSRRLCGSYIGCPCGAKTTACVGCVGNRNHAGNPDARGAGNRNHAGNTDVRGAGNRNHAANTDARGPGTSYTLTSP